MKPKSLLSFKNCLRHTVQMSVIVAFITLGVSWNVSAQKFNVTASDSQVDQAKYIKLSGSTIGKFYYLFRIDELGNYQFITFMVGQSYELNYAPQIAEGKYVVYEFDDFKGMPFNFELYKPADGILQTGEITITSNQN